MKIICHKDFKWQIKFAKTNFKHNNYCKRSNSQREILKEISSKPVAYMDLEQLFQDTNERDFILLFDQPKIGKTMLAKKIALDQ